MLEQAIDALPEDFRTVFVMRAVEQLTCVETAECLGIPEDTVKARLHRAQLRLQEVVLSSLDSSYAHAYDFRLSRCDRVVSRVFERLGLSAV